MNKSPLNRSFCRWVWLLLIVAGCSSPEAPVAEAEQGAGRSQPEVPPAEPQEGTLPAQPEAPSAEAERGTHPPPLAVAPFDAEQARAHQEAWSEYLRQPKEITNSIGMRLVLIPPGEFIMGLPEDAKRRRDFEGPQHSVRMTKPFYLAVYPVTQEEYERMMETNPSSFSHDGRNAWRVWELDTSRHPVEHVSWNDAVDFCRKLSALPAERSADREYRLPTEAEWEYACRAGTTTAYSFGDDPSELDEYGWHLGNSKQRTHRVGQKRPNPWGLYDMHGNLFDWCADWFDPEYYANSPGDDPQGPASGSGRVCRGGSWMSGAELHRSGGRFQSMPDSQQRLHGFRIALTPAAEP